MSVLAIILIVLAAIVILLAIGGTVAAKRRQQANYDRLRAQVEEANEQLAFAKAEDRGWERSTMEAAAREAFGAQTGGSLTISELHLVQVIDKPGTDDDEAVYVVETPDGKQHRVRLGRRGGDWIPAAG